MLELRKYQKEAVTAAMLNENGIIVAPTGSGKSLIIAAIVNATYGKTIIFQPSREILEQNFEKINSFGFEGATIYSASLQTKEIGKATFATIGSVIKKTDQFEDCETVIIDECHLVNAKGGQYLEFIDAIKPKKIIGLTATPYRLSTSSWGAQIKMLTRTRPRVFKDIIHVTQTKDLVEGGYLHNPTFEAVATGDDMREILKPNSTGANFSDDSVRRYLDAIDIVNQIQVFVRKGLSHGAKHVLVFTQTVNESNIVVDKLLKGWGLIAATVSAETPAKERKELLQKFKSGDISIMVNVGVLTTGFDFPELDCLVIGRPTMSLALWYQMVGRIVRPHPDKKAAQVYDICGNYTFFGNPLDMTLAKNGKLWDIFNEQGRLTTKTLDEPPMHEEAMKFGKYKGQKISDVPTSYLQWLCTVSDHKPTVTKFGLELKRRELAGVEQ